MRVRFVPQPFHNLTDLVVSCSFQHPEIRGNRVRHVYTAVSPIASIHSGISCGAVPRGVGTAVAPIPRRAIPALTLSISLFTRLLPTLRLRTLPFLSSL